MKKIYKYLLVSAGVMAGALAASQLVGAQEWPGKSLFAPHQTEPKPKKPVHQAPVRKAAPAPAAAPVAAPAASTNETTKFQGWTVICSPTGQAAQPCSCIAKMGILKNKEDPRPVLIVDIVKADGKSTLVLHTPTTVDLTPGVTMQIGNAAPLKLNYVSCEPAFCTAAIPLDDNIARLLGESPTASTSWIGLGVGEVRVAYALQEVSNTIAFLGTR